MPFLFDNQVEQHHILDIYLNQETMQTVRGAFPYLCGQRPAEDVVIRRVAGLNFKLIQNHDEFQVEALRIRSVPLWHGGSYRAGGARRRPYSASSRGPS